MIRSLLPRRAAACFVVIYAKSIVEHTNIILLQQEKLYPVVDYHDKHLYELGHIPYNDKWFSAMGTTISRTCFNLWTKPVKVIVVDGDNTLWQGVVAEEGIQGIRFDEARRNFHQMLINQQQAGVLLCVCSKNIESEVMAVFAEREDCLLKKEHLTAWKINWQAKSKNIQSLAQELDLGLDSFVVIDDNPVECAEISSHCPEVLCLQFPQRATY